MPRNPYKSDGLDARLLPVRGTDYGNDPAQITLV